ncbi:MAG: PAS domain S-box protein [Candidatus Thiodiazotropha sp.]
MKPLLSIKRHLYFMFGSLAFIEAGIIAVCMWLLTPESPTPAIIFSLALALALTLALTWIVTTRLSDSLSDYSKCVEMITAGTWVKQWPIPFSKEFDRLRDNLQGMAVKFQNRENAFRENEQRLKELVSNVPGVVYQFMATTPDAVESQSSVITVIREKCPEILGIDPEPERFFDEFVACLPEADQPGFLLSIQQAVANQSAWHYEGQFIKPGGDKIWFEAHSVPRQVGNQTVFYGLVTDITERKHMEQALSENQQRLDLALSGANEGIWDWDLIRNEVYFDTRYYTMAGYLPYEFPSALEEWEQRTHTDDLERVKSVVDKYLTGELESFEVEFRFLRKDGRYMWIQGRGKIVDRDEAGKPLRFIGTHTDISHRKSMEKSLRLTQFIFDKAPIGIWKMGKGGEVLDVNEMGCSSLGYTRDELQQMTVFDFAPGFEKEDWKYGISVLKKENTRTVEAQHQRNNGEIFPIQVIENVMHFEGEEFHVAFVQDITERKRDEKELYRLRNYLTNIIDSMPSALIGVDSEGRVTQWNKTVEHATGVDADSARGSKIVDLLPWMSTVTEKIIHSIRTREVIHEQANTRPCDNHACYEDVTIYPLVTNGVEGAVIRIDDVSEKVKLQEMMIQSEKMLSVGGLAAGMAHEINNPLAGILQTANVLSNRLVDKLDNSISIKAAEVAGTTTEAIQTFMQDRGIPRMLDAIKDSGSRIAEIVDNMLSFARKGSATITSHSLNELVDKSIKLAMADYDLKKEYDFKQIEILREYDDQLPDIPCEGAKIQQVILNLLSNGAQAMAQNETAPSRFILRTYLDQPAKQVCLEIEDNGPGMDESTRKRVFEPFFTTKPVGVGTGLGLSISYFIITENHHGHMSVESLPGKGSRFKVCLPLHRESSA